MLKRMEMFLELRSPRSAVSPWPSGLQVRLLADRLNPGVEHLFGLGVGLVQCWAIALAALGLRYGVVRAKLRVNDDFTGILVSQEPCRLDDVLDDACSLSQGLHSRMLGCASAGARTAFPDGVALPGIASGPGMTLVVDEEALCAAEPEADCVAEGFRVADAVGEAEGVLVAVEAFDADPLEGEPLGMALRGVEGAVRARRVDPTEEDLAVVGALVPVAIAQEEAGPVGEAEVAARAVEVVRIMGLLGGSQDGGGQGGDVEVHGSGRNGVLPRRVIAHALGVGCEVGLAVGLRETTENLRGLLRRDTDLDEVVAQAHDLAVGKVPRAHAGPPRRLSPGTCSSETTRKWVIGRSGGPLWRVSSIATTLTRSTS